MTRASFDKTALLYNFIEKHICADYSSASALIAEYLPLGSHETIIDVGGGTGLVAKLLRGKTPDSDIIVIDLSRGMLQKVNDPTLTTIQGDVTCFPIKDETFTLAILINTIHHIDENKQRLVLQEVFRILKKQGRIFIIDIWFLDTFVSNFFVRLEKLLVGTTYHLTADQMKQAVQDTGFHDVSLYFQKKNPYRYVTIGIR